MKKRTKKLALNRETLVHLENDLGQIVGGLTAVTECGTRTCMPPHSGCEYSGAGRQTCLTCQRTCTTNLC